MGRNDLRRKRAAGEAGLKQAFQEAVAVRETDDLQVLVVPDAGAVVGDRSREPVPQANYRPLPNRAPREPGEDAVNLRICLGIAAALFGLVYVLAVTRENLPEYDRTPNRGLRGRASGKRARGRRAASGGAYRSARGGRASGHGFSNDPVPGLRRPRRRLLPRPVPRPLRLPLRLPRTLRRTRQLAVNDVQRVLTMQFPTPLASAELRSSCASESKIMAVTLLESGQVRDAVVVAGEGPPRHFVSVADQDAFRDFLQANSLQQCFHVAFPWESNPVGALAAEALQSLDLPVESYRVYLVLSRSVSEEIQTHVNRRMHEQSLAKDDIRRVQLVFQRTPEGLAPAIADVQGER